MTDPVPSKECDCCKDGFFPFCPCGCHQRAAAQRVALAVSLEQQCENLRRENVRWENAHKILLSENDRLRRQVGELSIHAEKWVKRALGGATPEPFPDPDVGARFTAEDPETSNDWGVREAFKTIESYIRPGSALPGAVLYLKREIRKLEKLVMEESARASQPPAMREDELIAWTCACAFIGLDREQTKCPACGMARPTQPPGDGQR
jgi:hypothetical protein